MQFHCKLKREHGNPVSQTIDSPIMIFDFWELSDAFTALFTVLIFGVVFYAWGLMFVLLLLVLGLVPVIKKRHPRGIFFHWPYRFCGITLPGLLNPKAHLEGPKKYSD